MHPAIQELQQHGRALRRLACDLVGASAADDVLQDAAVEVMRAPPREPGPLLAWLRAVVRNVAGKRRRADAVRRRHELAAARAEAFTANGTEAADTLRWLVECVSALPEPYRSTLLARYLREQTPSEIATATGDPVRTVKTRLQRGLQLLRECFDQDGRDWRAAFGAAFGLPVPDAAAEAITTGILMGTMTKWAIAAAALLAVGFGVWQLAPRTGAATTNAVARVEPVAPTAAPVAAQPAAAATPVRAPEPERVAVPAPPASITRAGSDQIVVHVVDELGAPIETFGLREHMAAGLGMGEKERPLRHPGTHAGGRLLVAATLFEQHNYVVEDAAGFRLPSSWIGAADAVERDGERVIEVRMPLPREVTVRIVRERTGEAVAGTCIELLRPYPASPEVTLRTNAQPSQRLRVQPEVNPLIVNFTGGWALLLDSEVTDADGRVRLRVNAGEQFALRVLGPGHQPCVRQPWSVAADQAEEIVEKVVTGAAIEVRAIPAAALERLRVGLPEPAVEFHPQVLAAYAPGVQLRNVRTGHTHPAAAGMLPTKVPFDSRGICTIDGIEPGEWEVWLGFSWRMVGDPSEKTLRETGLVERLLPGNVLLAEHEQRIVEVDVTDWPCGSVDIALQRDGRPETKDVVLVAVLGGDRAAFQLRTTPNVRAGVGGRFQASLPPGRYFAKWSGGEFKNAPLGEIAVHPGQATRKDFVIESLALRMQVSEADGSVAEGMVELRRDGWAASAPVAASGLVSFASVLRDDPLLVTFRRATGKNALGRPAFGPLIELGRVRATGDATPIVLRLPAR